MPATSEPPTSGANDIQPVSAPAATGSAVPPSTGEIHVVPQPIEPHDAPKPGSAKARMFDQLRSKAKVEGEVSAPPPRTVKPAKSDPAKAPPAPPVEADSDEAEPVTATATEVAPGEEPDPAPAAPAATPDTKGKKVSPWKLLDEAKERLTKTEKELAETRSKIMPDADRQVFEERVTKAEARVKELEDHMRFVDYSKSPEFKQKYQEPYEKAWTRAMAELRELSIDDGQGNQRPVSPNDMLELVQMPLGKAREIAEQVFGSFADDVMSHRKEIKTLFEAQAQALEEARKTGAEREKQTMEQQNAKRNELQKIVSEAWTKENEAVVKNEQFGKFFTPREGDEAWNESLNKGFALVDKAFAESPLDPKLTAEERQQIIRRHAAVRNRAASWGALRVENTKLANRVAELEKELGQYREGEPGTGGTAPATTPAAPASATAAAFNALRKYAR